MTSLAGVLMEMVRIYRLMRRGRMDHEIGRSLGARSNKLPAKPRRRNRSGTPHEQEQRLVTAVPY